MGLTLIPAI